MPEQRKQAHINFWLIASVVALCAAVVAMSYQARLGQWQADIDNCNTVTVPAALSDSERDADLAFFAETAAAARRADGEESVADNYDEVATSSRARARQAAKRAGVPCTDRFKRPGFAW